VSADEGAGNFQQPPCKGAFGRYLSGQPVAHRVAHSGQGFRAYQIISEYFASHAVMVYQKAALFEVDGSALRPQKQ
jgi:hypothetical protein